MMLAGLRVLAEQEQIYQGRFEELRREVRLGVLEAERGELLDATSEIGAIRQRLTRWRQPVSWHASSRLIMSRACCTYPSCQSRY